MRISVEAEKEFHDKWASEIDVSEINVESYFESSTAPENRFIMSHMKDLSGKHVLELGCGAGESSVYFAMKGAKCVATDCSPKMIETAHKLAEKYCVTIEGQVMSAMDIKFPENSFDYVYAANLLHHVDPIVTLNEMYRVLKPGGKLCFWDPLKHNPIINVYRKIATEVRTEDERPLNINIISFLQKKFSDVDYDTFWLCTLWIFIRFYFIERVNPNEERYWKKILFEEQRLRRLYYRLEKIDKYIKKVPMMKRFAWNIAVVATK